MQISRYWFRTRIEKGLPRTNLSFEPKKGYSIRCKCENCNEEFNRKFGLNDFKRCAGCRAGDRGKTLETKVRASQIFTDYYSNPDNRIKKSEAVKELYKDKDFIEKQRKGCELRSQDFSYRQKLSENAARGTLHAVRTSCGKQKIKVDEFSGFITDLDVLERQRCKETVGKECLHLANYKCDTCSAGKDFNAHHMNGWHWATAERFDLNNLVCLCHGCHSHFHTIYGRKNNTREQYQAFKLSKTQGGVQ